MNCPYLNREQERRMAKKRREAPKPEAVPREALRWTEPVLPDVMPPKGGDDLSKGFLHNSYSMRAEPACSSSVYHGIGRNDKTTSQGTRHLYSTRLLALKAMRHEVENEAAKKLHEIDKLIEQELRDAAPRSPEEK
jgi:hypothetical protein